MGKLLKEEMATRGTRTWSVGMDVGRKREVREKEKGRQHRDLGPNETRDLLRTKAPLQVKALPCRSLEPCPALRRG